MCHHSSRDLKEMSANSTLTPPDIRKDGLCISIPVCPNKGTSTQWYGSVLY